MESSIHSLVLGFECYLRWRYITVRDQNHIGGINCFHWSQCFENQSRYSVILQLPVRNDLFSNFLVV